MENILFDIAFGLYILGMGCFLWILIRPNSGIPRHGKTVFLLAAAAHLASILVRTFIARQIPGNICYVPWSNWYESFSFFALVISALFIGIQMARPLPILGVFITPITVASMAMATHSPFGRAIPTLPPALQSVWMALHVPVMFFSYAAFVNAFGIGLAFLLQEFQLKSKKPGQISFQLPPLDELDDLIYRLIALAFPLLTSGIILGALWAHQAWGRYWGWDPKETWSFITWMIYLIYLHTRLMAGWRGRKSAYLSLIGFAMVLFTYIGVNYLSHLHGFLSGGGK